MSQATLAKVVVVAFLWTGLIRDAGAAPITLSDFSGNETVVTFAELGFPSSLTLVPITVGAVTYTDRGFNNSLGGPSGLFAIGFLQPTFDNVPSSGNPRLSDQNQHTLLRLDFSVPVNRVGLFFSSLPVTAYTITAFDDNLIPLDTSVFTMLLDGHAAFAGVEFAKDIARVEIEEVGSDRFIMMFDDLRFESVPSVPEPSLLVLLGVGLSAVAARVYRRHWGGTGG